ncbi:MAG: filamentous hemagglutinin N-terminal domain-containing protein [Bacteroidales bacterium]|nr:filamentous hemagglutinin N-terminal domain-containing protein [Bacteroidales bacterium]
MPNAIIKYCIIFFVYSLAFSNPSSSDVKSGDVTLHASGNTLSIIQKSDAAIVNWNDFSIKENEITKIIQPSSKSSILNRVTGNNISLINGKLSANGCVYLINKNGVVIGPNGVVNANCFYASTLEMMDDEFLSSKDITLRGSSSCKIINHGTINTSDGEVYLIAKEVENYGNIDTNGNPVNIIGASEVLLVKKENNAISIKTKKECLKKLKDDLNNSNPYSYAINLQEDDDKIISNENTNVIVKGTINAKDSKVHIFAEDITIDNALIDVSGSNEKEVLIGGDFQGNNSSYKNAKNVFITEGSIIQASAKDSGDGGKVIVWSDKKTDYYGNTFAQGGSASGDGGLVEISGKEVLNYKGRVFTLSENGQNGKLLLDPYNITISTAATANGSFDGGDPNTFTPSNTPSVLNNSDLVSNLASTDVIVSTVNGGGAEQGNITVSNDITWGAKTKLSLLAENKVFINDPVTISNTRNVQENFDAIEIIGSGSVAGATYIGVENEGIITSIYGNIYIRGQGGDTGSDNYGIFGDNNSEISSTGTGSEAATITIIGIGGAGTDNNRGVYLNTSTITSAYGAISITGTGNGSGISNYGVYHYDSSEISSTGDGASAATITIQGTGGNGTNTNRGVYVSLSTITSKDGAISITGTGRGSGTDNRGIYNSGGTISSTGTSATAASLAITGTGSDGTSGNSGVYCSSSSITSSALGALSITGTGGDGTSSNYGIYTASGATITAVLGSITLTGTGGQGSGDSNRGIYHSGASTISSTGTGASAATITITATGGSGVSSNRGLYNNNSTITSKDGAISITGTGNGTGTINYGIYNFDSAVISSTGTGTYAASITLNGTGSSNGTSDNNGVYNLTSSVISSVDGDISITGVGNGSTTDCIGIFNDNSTIESTGSGSSAAKITLIGTGGNGTDDNIGVYNNNSTAIIRSVDGDISITGTGRGSGDNNYGISIDDGAIVQSTGTGAYAASINMTGTGSNGTERNYGLAITLAGSTVTSVDGDITLTGTGQGTTTDNYGLYNYNGGTISSTGTTTSAATITLTGTGGNGTNANRGVYNNTSTITSVIGNINITATGGGNGTGVSNYGLYNFDSGVISSTGTGTNAGTITITGTGGSGTSDNRGVYNNGSTITSSDGDISITGTGNGSTIENYGVYNFNSGTISSSGTGTYAADITILGVGGGGTNNNYGVYNEGVSDITSVDGNITIEGYSNGTGTGNYGIVHEGTLGDGTTTGNIKLGADTKLYSGTIQTTGILTLQPYTTSYPLNIGTGTNDYISTAELLTYTTGYAMTIFGRSNGSHAVTLGDGSGSLTVGNNASFRGDNIILTEPLIATGLTINMFIGQVNNGTLTLNSTITASSINVYGTTYTSNTIEAYDINNSWNIIGRNRGYLTGGINFYNVQNLTGGIYNDLFILYDGQGVDGIIDGGNSSGNTLDYSKYTTPVYINFDNQTATNIGGYRNIQFFIGDNIASIISTINNMFLSQRIYIHNAYSPLFFILSRFAQDYFLHKNDFNTLGNYEIIMKNIIMTLDK